jgi:hypothetical protein
VGVEHKMELNGLSKNNIFGETWFPKTKQLLFRLLDPSIHFFQGFSEDLPHHTARIFAQARVAS